MICPSCLKNEEVAYSAMTGQLICLGPDCTWERRLNEDETFELFFGSRKTERGFGEAYGVNEALVHECAS